MNWEDYINEFQKVMEGTNTSAPYDQTVYQEYVKMNSSRVNRWMKKNNVITDETKEAFASISAPQKWILITEPWCGDAAHNAPMIKKMAELSDHIDLEIQLRDSGSEIDNYLTNGGKSIPKLIVRNEHGEDIFTWGARPEECQNLVMEMKHQDVSIQDKHMRIQQWYNKDKGGTIQKEFIDLLG